jgi:miniconductance mechanosensitive channel
LIEILSNWLASQGISEPSAVTYARWIAAALTVLLSYLAYMSAKRFLLPAVAYSVSRTISSLDNVLAENRVTRYLAFLAPAMVLFFMTPIVLFGYPYVISLVQKATLIFMILAGVLAIRALLSGLLNRYHRLDVTKEIPLTSFFQVISVAVYLTAGLLILGIVLERNPLYLLSGFGAVMAILTIVFRDPLLGLMAGIQLTSNKLVARGDKIDLPKYDASGEILKVAMTTVTIRNADQSITTVPTYALISESFKNWRGIEETGARFIQRAILIDVHSVRICTPEMLARFEQVELAARPNAQETVVENGLSREGSDTIADDNDQTNLGIFRDYILSYLCTLPQIHQDRQLMVRLLAQSAKGLPLEINAYSKETDIVKHEMLQALIIEHVLAKAAEYDLKVYQDPTNGD